MLGHRTVWGACAILFAALVGAGAASAADCPGKPDAIGTSRTLYVEPTEHIRLGMMQYPETLPLADHEVVLTFDDGPLPPHTTHVLDTLASECVKATFFLVGRQVRAFPELVRRLHAAGHTIGTHSQNHPLRFHHMTAQQADQEVEGGISAVVAALGDRNALAPFFRIPGLLRSDTVEQYLAGKSLMAWSADFPADDWLRISANEIAARALRRIEARGRGMLLLHDIKPATAKALPIILHELKKRGYRIVHVEPASAEHPKTPTRVAEWASRKGGANKDGLRKTVAWPRPSLSIELLLAEPSLPVADPQTFGLDSANIAHPAIGLPHQPVFASAHDQVPLPPEPSWPPAIAGETPATIAHASEPVLPVPGPNSFGIGPGAVPVPGIAAGKRHAAVSGAPRSAAPTAGKRQPAHPTAQRPQPAATGKRQTANPTAPRAPAAVGTPQQSGDAAPPVRPRKATRRAHVAEAGVLDFLFAPKPPAGR